MEQYICEEKGGLGLTAAQRTSLLNVIMMSTATALLTFLILHIARSIIGVTKIRPVGMTLCTAVWTATA